MPIQPRNRRSKGRVNAPFKAFLSHRYQSPAVNLFFFRLFEKAAAVQFEVDAGKGSLNVTRLERMLRSADAFVGIYPFPGATDRTPTPEELRKESQYFRLELELAARSDRPALVFSDQRYGGLLDCPRHIQHVTYDPLEIAGEDPHSPREQAYLNQFSAFVQKVLVRNRYRAEVWASPPELTKVGVLVPPTELGGYDLDAIATVTTALAKTGLKTVIVKWPPVLNAELYATLTDADWMVIDVGPTVAATGILGFLHRQLTPMLRLRQLGALGDPPSPIENTLFGGVEVGYPKDIVQWQSVAQLKEGLEARIARIGQPVSRMSTYEAAYQYFNTAALRKETVFVSYSNRDGDIAADVVRGLKRVFQTVFDYQDGQSIVAGQPWLKEIFQTIATSALGVALLSKDYLESGNCAHELRAMTARKDEQKLELVPVKLRSKEADGEKLQLPSYLDGQYLRYWTFDNPSDVVKAIVAAYDEGKRRVRQA